MIMNSNEQKEENKDVEMNAMPESVSSSRNSSPASVRSFNSGLTGNSANSNKNQSSIISSEWICEDCVINKKPLNGQIVWSKVGK